MRPEPIVPGPGQESVWDYPRPPRIEPSSELVTVRHGDVEVARSTRTLRVLETSQPPAYYVPAADVDESLLDPSPGRSYCEWKGEASYFDLGAGTDRIVQAAWTYRSPTEPFLPLVDHYAFYAQKLGCSVDGELVEANAGTFYGGWITSKVVGPFKGGAGSGWW